MCEEFHFAPPNMQKGQNVYSWALRTHRLGWQWIDNNSSYGQQNKTLKTIVVIQNWFFFFKYLNQMIFNMKQQSVIPEQMTIMFFLENQKHTAQPV